MQAGVESCVKCEYRDRCIQEDIINKKYNITWTIQHNSEICKKIKNGTMEVEENVTQ